jgi:MFS transporter, PAT family, beta-lactamase induction signal transducer AmpG
MDIMLIVEDSAFMILILPWGIISGYIGVAVAYFLARAGVTTEQIAGLLALGFIPQTWKFLWAPIVDTTLNQRKMVCASRFGLWFWHFSH